MDSRARKALQTYFLVIVDCFIVCIGHVCGDADGDNERGDCDGHGFDGICLE